MRLSWHHSTLTIVSISMRLPHWHRVGFCFRYFSPSITNQVRRFHIATFFHLFLRFHSPITLCQNIFSVLLNSIRIEIVLIFYCVSRKGLCWIRFSYCSLYTMCMVLVWFVHSIWITYVELLKGYIFGNWLSPLHHYYGEL